MKGKIKISQMHFALRSTCFISMAYRAVCLQAKPSWYHMATAVIIWMLWCTSTTTVPRECAQSLNAPSRWHLKRTVWIWIFDCALHLQIVGFGSRKVSSDCRANHSQCLNQGERNEMQKKAPLPLSLATYMKHQCLQFIYSCYSGAGKICQTHKWHVCQREVIYVINVCSQAKKQQSPILWKMLLQISQLCDRSLIKVSSPKDRGIMWAQLFQITVENTAYILLGFDLWIYYTV